MARRRLETMEENRAKLVAAARRAFAEKGYSAASMDELTASVGLTRGALYHNFGDKRGLLAAVVDQIDTEMATQAQAVAARVSDDWEGMLAEGVAYIEMALEPEIQRIMFRDGPAVLGDISQWPTSSGCIAALSGSVERLKADGVMADIDTEAAARLINGSSSHAALWIANSDAPEETSKRAVQGFRTLLEGLRVEG